MIIDMIKLSEVSSNQDTRVLARCSVCGDKMECSVGELSYTKINADNKCLYCDKCFNKLFQKLEDEPF